MSEEALSWSKRTRRKYRKDGTSRRPRRREGRDILFEDSETGDEMEETKVARGKNILFRKDHQLSSALIISEIDYILTYRDKPEALRLEHTLLLSHIGERGVIHPKWAYSFFLNNLNTIASPNKKLLSEFNTLIDISLLATRISTKDYPNSEKMLHIERTEEIELLYLCKVEFR